MADTKISGLSALSADKIVSADVIPIVNANETKKVTVGDLSAHLVSAIAAVANEAATSAELASVDARVTSAGAIAAEAATSAELASVDSRITSAVQVASAAATSADGHAATASAAATSADAHAAAASAAATSVAAVASLATSALGTSVQTASAAATSADAHAAAASAAATSVAAVASLAVSALGTSVQTASAAATSADGHANTVSVAAADALSHAVAASAAATSCGAVASAAATSCGQVASAAATSVNSRVTSVNNDISVVSNKLSNATFRGQTWVISAPATGGIPGPRIAVNGTAKQINAYTISADTTVTLNIENRATVGAAGTDLMAADLACSLANASGAINAGVSALTAGNWLWVDIAGTSGSPACVVITLTTTQP